MKIIIYLDYMSDFIISEEQTFDQVEQAFKDKINDYADVAIQQHMKIYKDTDKKIYDNLVNIYNVLKNTNVCCTPEEKEFLLNLAIQIQQVFNGPPYTFKDICLAVIYTYYGLNLMEVNYLNISVLPRNRENKIIVNQRTWNLSKEFNLWINAYADNITVVYYLYLRLGAPSTTQPEFGPIISTTGEDLSESLRKFVFNLDKEPPLNKRQRIGGSKKSKHKRTKTKTKPKKSKTKRRRPSRKP
uniref:Uncharacterized protein n=1 Tax=viral metagenome TaxID=1070528 RepID=A0A6C0CUZ7_9ZZZZ